MMTITGYSKDRQTALQSAPSPQVYLGREFLKYFYTILDFEREEVRLKIIHAGTGIAMREMNEEYIVVY
jgi:hypothetical protein